MGGDRSNIESVGGVPSQNGLRIAGMIDRHAEGEEWDYLPVADVMEA